MSEFSESIQIHFIDAIPLFSDGFPHNSATAGHILNKRLKDFFACFCFRKICATLHSKAWRSCRHFISSMATAHLLGGAFGRDISTWTMRPKRVLLLAFGKYVEDFITRYLLHMINAVYSDKPLIFIGATFREKLFSHHQAVTIHCWKRFSLSRLFLTLYLTW